ncbi:MAG: Mur ligase family protein [Lachnospiraceae bacterium]
MSTVENYDGVSRSESVMTTPEAPTLHEHILHAKQKGIRYMTMEVSSQALKYRRVRELQFQVGIFLNISRDHISPKEHVDFEDYFSSKLSLFRQTEVACVNLNRGLSGPDFKGGRTRQSVLSPLARKSTRISVAAKFGRRDGI